MKKIIKREEVAQLLITDDFFESKNLKLKIWQSFVGIAAWLGVFAPFIWLFFAHKENLLNGTLTNHFFKYEVMRYENKLFFYLLSIFVSLTIFFIILTFWNNRQFKYKFKKEKMYDEARLNKRRELLEDAYDERFGEKGFREVVRYYSVKEEQNLSTDFVQEIYRKGET